MATVYTSGDLPTSNQYIKFCVEITVNSQDESANTSNVTVKLKFRRTNSGYDTYGAGTCYAKVNGTEYTQAVTSSQHIVYAPAGSGVTLFARTFTISHDDDGTKDLEVQGRVSISSVGLGGNYQTYSHSLPTINRGVMYVKVNGTWRKGIVFVKVNGTWRQGEGVFVKVNGTWRRSI